MPSPRRGGLASCLLSGNIFNGEGDDGPVFLHDIWPSPQEIDETIAASVDGEMFRRTYGDVFTGDERWAVDFNACGLGFFTFSKFLMWRDLDANTWPDALTLLKHSRILSLFGEGSGFAAPVPIVDDYEPIDRKIDLAKAVHVLDADSSQAIAIEESRCRTDLVIQGPPGTGKSQTIANIIAAAVHDGRSVLFVAEKAAALEVVHSRLKNLDLDPLCLELHSRKATKLAVLGSLQKALQAGATATAIGGVVEPLSEAGDRLNRRAEILHQPIGSSGLICVK